MGFLAQRGDLAHACYAEEHKWVENVFWGSTRERQEERGRGKDIRRGVEVERGEWGWEEELEPVAFVSFFSRSARIKSEGCRYTVVTSVLWRRERCHSDRGKERGRGKEQQRNELPSLSALGNLVHTLSSHCVQRLRHPTTHVCRILCLRVIRA